jgi:hypothetical protein
MACIRLCQIISCGTYSDSSSLPQLQHLRLQQQQTRQQQLMQHSQLLQLPAAAAAAAVSLELQQQQQQYLCNCHQLVCLPVSDCTSKTQVCCMPA